MKTWMNEKSTNLRYAIGWYGIRSIISPIDCMPGLPGMWKLSVRLGKAGSK